MHTTANGATNASVAEDVDGFSDLPEPRQDRLLRSSERAVRELAPPPSPLTEDYRESGRDAEIAVVEFMLTTQGGILKSASLSDTGSVSYADLQAVREVVRNAMGRYYTGGEPSSSPVSGGASLSNVSDHPLF